MVKPCECNKANHISVLHALYKICCCYFSKILLFYKPICTRPWGQISGLLVDHLAQWASPICTIIGNYVHVLRGRMTKQKFSHLYMHYTNTAIHKSGDHFTNTVTGSHLAVWITSIGCLSKTAFKESNSVSLSWELAGFQGWASFPKSK